MIPANILIPSFYRWESCGQGYSLLTSDGAGIQTGLLTLTVGFLQLGSILFYIAQ